MADFCWGPKVNLVHSLLSVESMIQSVKIGPEK